MAPAKATVWPESLHEDPDVLMLDVHGKYILCRVCTESYALRKGKKPKPVAMNACFRTRAWETHKVRTRAHRLQQETARAASTRRDPAPRYQSSPVVSTFTSERATELQRRVEREPCVLPSLQQVTVTPKVNWERLAAPYAKVHCIYEAVSPLVFPLSRYPSQRRPKDFLCGRNVGAEPRGQVRSEHRNEFVVYHAGSDHLHCPHAFFIDLWSESNKRAWFDL